ncbi:MAG: 2,3-diphosphoglycerate-dependent phosphoglycerate mutase [Bacteroidales bacterium]|nr:2,3-diphosphoglycerate-dependent phosphoglycerate mutase [Bacteroidales bacterium]
MKQLILVRHGESEWNKLNLFTGWTNVDLSENGINEAKEAGRALLEAGYRPEICFTSYLKRAIKTLNNILDVMDLDWLPVSKTWRLNEKSYGQLQGSNKVEMAKKYGDDMVQKWRRSFDVQPPAFAMDDPKSPRQDPRYAEMTDEQIPLTESLKDCINRLMPYYKDVILKAFENHDQVMVVAHGNSLRGIVKELRGMTNEEIIKFNIPTAIPYVFEFDDKMNLLDHKFIGDPDVVAAKMQSVANQGKAK